MASPTEQAPKLSNRAGDRIHEGMVTPLYRFMVGDEAADRQRRAARRREYRDRLRTFQDTAICVAMLVIAVEVMLVLWALYQLLHQEAL